MEKKQYQYLEKKEKKVEVLITDWMLKFVAQEAKQDYTRTGLYMNYTD